jgi:hypothetical protein
LLGASGSTHNAPPIPAGQTLHDTGCMLRTTNNLTPGPAVRITLALGNAGPGLKGGVMVRHCSRAVIIKAHAQEPERTSEAVLVATQRL